MARLPDGLGSLTRSVRRDVAVLAVAFGLPMALLTVQRVVLHEAWGQPSEPGPYAFAFLHGLRFDAAGIAYPFALALIGATVAALRGAFRTERAAWTAVTAWIAFVAAAELPFFAEFRARLDGTALEYLDDPATVFGTATGGHLTAALLGGLGAIVATLYAWRAVGRAQGETRAAGRALLLSRGSAIVVLALLIRGGIDRPLRPADAAAETHHLTQLTLSGPWTILRSAYEAAKDGGRGIDYGIEDDEAALRLARDLFLLPPSTFERDDRPMLRNVGQADAEQRNVLLVVLESFGARHVGALGAERSWTPQLDALVEERGQLFSRCLANGPTTNRALPALLAGLPSTPRQTALTKSLDGQRELLTIGRVLGEQGWRTAFVTGGAASWENLGGWCRTQGFETIVDREAFPEGDRLSVWGVADGPLLDETFRRCDDYATAGERFCVVALTGSNHPPFAVPDDFLPDEADARQRALRYADECAGSFVRRVLEAPWAPSTDIYVVGDHGITESPRAAIDPERHHVLLWLTQGGPDPPIENRWPVGHTDVPTTILERSGYHGLFAGWGAGLFHGLFEWPVMLGPRGGAHVIGVLGWTGLAVDHLDGRVELFGWNDLEHTLSPRDRPETARRLSEIGRAVLHTADRAIREGRAGR